MVSGISEETYSKHQQYVDDALRKVKEERKRRESNFDKGIGLGLVGASIATFLAIFLFVPVGIFLWVYLPSLSGAGPNVFPQTFPIIFGQSVVAYFVIVLATNMPFVFAAGTSDGAKGYIVGVVALASVVALTVGPFIVAVLGSLP